MKKLLLFISLYFYLSLSFGQDIKAPDSINMLAFSKRPLLEGYHMYAPSIVRPFGWSKSGKFAYVEETFPRGKGGKNFTYFIVNTINDIQVWKLEDYWASADTGIEKSVKKNKNIILSQFQQHEIRQGLGTDFKKLPLTKANDIYDVKLIEIKKTGKVLQAINESGIDSFIGDLQRVKILITLNKSKNKMVFSKSDPKVFSHWIAGYFMSPFENRMIIAIGVNRMGVEGVEDEFIYTGCLLEKGFK